MSCSDIRGLSAVYPWLLVQNLKIQYTVTVDLVIFECLDFRILGLFAMAKIRELSISMIGSTKLLLNYFSRDS